jgi:ubiquinone/menaquinone biosynthesis C-methylase UbiE
MPTATFRDDPKQAAIDQWTSDPCGLIDGTPGTRDYFERLLASRDEYVISGGNGQWMIELLDYAGTRGLRVLDVGCGQGTDLYRYAASGADAVGIDLTPRHAELARAHLEAMQVSGEVVLGDAETLPFPDGNFNRVSSNGVLHHTPDMPAALREIRRVLKPRGRATIIVYYRDSTYFWITKILREGIVRGGLFRESLGDLMARVEVSSIDAKPLVRVYSRRQLREMMRAAGFADVQLTVRHEFSDLTPLLRRSPRLHDLAGRGFGWYVIARGQAPAA